MHSNKIYVSPLLVIFISISILFNVIDKTIMIYFLCIIHELFHLFVAKMFKQKINYVKLNISGFSISILDIEYCSFIQQFLIYISGPLSFIFSNFLLFIFCKLNIINLYQYHVFNSYNISLCLFNLLPLYPLDGGRILDIINKLFYPVKTCYQKRNIYNLITIIPLTIILIIKNQYIILTILISIYIENLINSDNYLTYLERRISKNNYSRTKYSFINQIFHFYKNIYLEKGHILLEEEIVTKSILKILKNRNK